MSSYKVTTSALIEFGILYTKYLNGAIVLAFTTLVFVFDVYVKIIGKIAFANPAFGPIAASVSGGGNGIVKLIGGPE
jgi:hypothetical protein